MYRYTTPTYRIKLKDIKPSDVAEATTIYQKNGSTWNQITQSELLEILESGTKQVRGE